MSLWSIFHRVSTAKDPPAAHRSPSSSNRVEPVSVRQPDMDRRRCCGCCAAVPLFSLAGVVVIGISVERWGCCRLGSGRSAVVVIIAVALAAPDPHPPSPTSPRASDAGVGVVAVTSGRVIVSTTSRPHVNGERVKGKRHL
ncbi:hypothetical protein, variant [Aphanomyces invadans]|uniref:Uncharacterized protein n=1 Tax=Aphanomyces invadans TaxID=157072 RepID=A0A024TK03_9STRA|nr:hypothetical protein, variant [Aphanomyces invadans]XP_008877130.1 hypothetical protein H310_12007 [Aphanomyces invadans]ETV94367.1 hypothetical protein H310_12007 [Aphanomyces invadans]ETV94368.1 hypothetical protein, variant [Aphanomyces invadans]|eukprot:XP_008877129.1 hypothetical protein, variant [Aphanomyces invadans]